MKTVRNKKIYVEPGVSVKATDFEKKELLQKPGQKNKKKMDSEKQKPKLKKMKTDQIKLKTEASKAEAEKDLDDITEYKEEIQIKTDTDKLKMEKQQQRIIEKNILNEKTGLMQTFIITDAIIEKPKSTILKENLKLKTKARNDLERDKIQSCLAYDDYIDSDFKENIGNPSDNETIETDMAPNLKRKSNADKNVINKLKNTPATRSKTLQSTSSTTTEEIIMSVHSDSDLDDISLEQTEDPDVIDLEQLSDNDTHRLELNYMDSVQEIINNDDEVVRKKNDEREAEIFNEIMRIESENDTDTKIEDTKTDDGVATESRMSLEYEHEEMNQKNDEGMKDVEQLLRTENENKSNCFKNIEMIQLKIGDNVLVRYYQKKKWQYYIGFIIEMNDQVEKKYKISYYKTISKKSDIKFKKPKRPDVDDIPDDLIVKKVELLQNNENNEFVLCNDEDSFYF